MFHFLPFLSCFHFPHNPPMMGVSASETFRCIRRSRLSPCDFLNDYHRRIDVKQPDTQGFIQNKEPGLGNNPENSRFFPLRYSSRNHSVPPSSLSSSHTHTHTELPPGFGRSCWEDLCLTFGELVMGVAYDYLKPRKVRDGRRADPPLSSVSH